MVAMHSRWMRPSPIDTDGDGTGNNADTDDDGDGVADGSDAFPLDASESVDTDGDGIGNNADTDDDGDGVADTEDAFDASESVDTDGDGVGDNADAFPNDPQRHSTLKAEMVLVITRTPHLTVTLPIVMVMVWLMRTMPSPMIPTRP